MKPETNNEMDLLLRRLGRSAADSRADADHLDADELSSYAESALPAAARARYTEHLAECASCRKLVAQLSSSAGVVSAAEAVKVSAPSALRKFLASLFAPMVLRYAVPALGLIVVAVIGFTVLRRDERADSVARVGAPQTTPAPSQPSEPVDAARDSRGFVESPDASPAPHPERSKEAQPAPSQTPAASTGQVAQANEPAPAAPVAKAEQPPPATTPAEPKPSAATEEDQKKPDAEARKQIANRSVIDLGRARSEASKEEERRADNGFTRSPAAPQAGSIAKVQRDGAGTADSMRAKDKNDDAETRSVAGRRFRRERGVWIDTAYDSSRSTVNVTRGSEQYRALIADEPVIKSIAEQLDGEIIVVWKGRAYRLR